MQTVALENDPQPPPVAKGKEHARRQSAWALVPDAEDASTWRLPLWYEGEQKPDVTLVRYALGRLSADANPTIPVRYAREARARIRDAWGVLYPEAELPKALQKGAVGSHHTATVDKPWSASTNEKRLPSPVPVATARAMYAWYDSEQVADGAVPKMACSFPHHEVSADGKPGPANLSACRNGLARLSQSNVPESAHATIQAHLRGHLNDGGSDVGKAEAITFDPAELEGQSDGVMVAFGLAPDVAEALAITEAPDGVTVEPVEAMHVTLAFMGSITTWPADQLETLAAALRSFAPYEWPLAGQVNGFAIFDVGTEPGSNVEQGAAVVIVDVPGLSEWQCMLRKMLADYGMAPASDHDFTAHVTLAYGPIEALRQLPQPPVLGVYFDSLILAAGGTVQQFPFDGPRLATALSPGEDAMPLILASAEQRFTLAPLYVPDALDSHKEWATGEDLQTMVWDYVRAGDRTIRLQHLPGTIAGESVEIVSWPFPLTAPMRQPDGTTKDVTFPAGTVYQGIVWEPWAFERVKAGQLNGISMGGAAYRVDDTPAGGG
jgi:2'-5' RNA ligase